MTKSQIRSYQKELRKQLKEEERNHFSSAITETLLNLAEYQNCSRLFTYVSFQCEVNTQELIRQSLVSGKEVFIPRVEPQGMEFYRIRQLEGLMISSFGVPEPQEAQTDRFRREDFNTGMDFYHPDINQNLMILPGLAFDPAGNRIGYGAGYYDRYLDSNRNIGFYKVALAYDFQVMDRIEAEEYDIKADLIITPSRILRI
jgi:5-formyltetrahydrofolate cyclo-ligase